MKKKKEVLRWPEKWEYLRALFSVTRDIVQHWEEACKELQKFLYLCQKVHHILPIITICNIAVKVYVDRCKSQQRNVLFFEGRCGSSGEQTGFYLPKETLGCTQNGVRVCVPAFYTLVVWICRVKLLKMIWDSKSAIPEQNKIPWKKTPVSIICCNIF